MEHALDEIAAQLTGVPENQKRFYAIKLFERDERIKENLQKVPEVESIISALENELDDDAESIITNERYEYIASIIKGCYKKRKARSMTTSDKIDRVVTNRWAALPIFAVVMFIVYYLSVTTVGTMFTDWVNDGLFGDGWHLASVGAEAYSEASDAYKLESSKVDAYIECRSNFRYAGRRRNGYSSYQRI